MCAVPGGCINLFARVVSQHNQVLTLPAWSAALREIAAAVVEGLTSLRRDQGTQNWRGGDTRKGHLVDSDTLAALLGALEFLQAPELRSTACAAIASNGKVFDPGAVIVPALRKLRDDGGTAIRNADHERLWIHVADILLARSEYPPAPPLDWRQDVELSCSCVDCRELSVFACDPVRQTHRFRVRKDRRQHLHRQIDRHRLDMRHVTERKGSPQSLVCMKTRDSHLRRCAEYRQDITALTALAELVDTSTGKCAAHCARIAAARRRSRRSPHEILVGVQAALLVLAAAIARAGLVAPDLHALVRGDQVRFRGGHHFVDVLRWDDVHASNLHDSRQASYCSLTSQLSA